MKQPGRQPGLRHALCLAPVSAGIAFQRDRQHAPLFAQLFGDHPAAGARVVRDVGPQPVRIHRVAVGIEGVFDQQRIGAERQQVDKTVAVLLRHGRVHQQWAVQAMRMREAQLLAEELLVAQHQVRAGPDATAVDHGLGPQGAAVGQRDDARRNRKHAAGGSHRRAERRSECGVEPRRGDRCVARSQPALPPRKSNAVMRPAVADQRRDPGMLRCAQVAVMERPSVVAAEPVAAFQQQHAQPRPLHPQPPGDQAVGQAATDQDQVGIVLRGCSGRRSVRQHRQVPAKNPVRQPAEPARAAAERAAPPRQDPPPILRLLPRAR